MVGLQLSLETAARLGLALLLLAAAAGKLRSPGRTLAGLDGVGVAPPFRRPLLAALVAVELTLGLLVATGVALRAAALAAGALGLLFAGVLLRTRARGVRRLACGCFGSARQRAPETLAARALLLSVLAAPVALGTPSLSAEAALGVAVAVLAAAVVALGALVLALYRQVGVLTLRLSPQGALELEGEGPALGADAPPLPGLERRGTELVLFSSAGCRLCHALLPSVRALARDGVGVRVADEDAEPDAFRRWNVPGTPFAVHLVDGRVAAKGLVNTLEQLEGLLATGRDRVGRAA